MQSPWGTPVPLTRISSHDIIDVKISDELSPAFNAVLESCFFELEGANENENIEIAKSPCSSIAHACRSLPVGWAGVIGVVVAIAHPNPTTVLAAVKDWQLSLYQIRRLQGRK